MANPLGSAHVLRLDNASLCWAERFVFVGGDHAILRCL